jgi:hypothetical protein
MLKGWGSRWMALGNSKPLRRAALPAARYSMEVTYVKQVLFKSHSRQGPQGWVKLQRRLVKATRCAISAASSQSSAAQSQLQHPSPGGACAGIAGRTCGRQALQHCSGSLLACTQLSKVLTSQRTTLQGTKCNTAVTDARPIIICAHSRN